MKTVHLVKIASLVSAGIILSACNGSKEEKEVALNLEEGDNKVAYAIGVSSGKAMAGNLDSIAGTNINLDKNIMAKAFADGLQNASQMDDEALQQVMNDFRGRVSAAMEEKRKLEQEEQAKLSEENQTAGAAYLAENKAKEGVVTLPSGMQYTVVQAGTGKSPVATDRVKVHYRGTLIDGSQFDSSYDRGQPATFGVNQVIKGWTEALQLMKEGSKWQLTIPAELAYGSTARPNIPGNSVLLFDVELLEVVVPEAKEAAE